MESSFFYFQREYLMMRNWLKFFYGLSAVAIVATAATTALAADLGIVTNGNIERESRFTPHGTPGVDSPYGVPDGWHHSSASAGTSGWNPTGDGMVTSGVHSLYHEDGLVGGHVENRSFARNLPAVGNLSRVLDLSWNWKWDITSLPTDVFSATVRISKNPATSLDLNGDPGGTAITDHTFLTGPGNSGGFLPFLASIPLAPDDRSFDIIFRSRDNVGDVSEMGFMWVDDVSATVPEPATMGLLSLAGLGLMMISRRRRG
jgi:hypothetical protein